MTTVRFSKLAESDLLDIGSYTLAKRGPAQTVQYLGSLEDACQRLVSMPTLGRPCEYIRPGLRRLEHDRHVIFYREHERGILISRILHQRMLPEHRAMGE